MFDLFWTNTAASIIRVSVRTPVNLSTLLMVFISIVVAFVMSFAATPVVKSFARRVGAMDVPKDARRMHDHPIPRLGGLAMFIGFILSVLLFADITTPVRGILLGSVLIVIIGVIDDIVSVKYWVKLLVQIAAAVVAILHGIVIDVLSNPNLFSEHLFLQLGWLAIPITIIWIVGITNSVNLIDGLDGLSVGVSAIASVTMLVIALLVSESNVAIILAALVGACLGFIPYNFNPAKIFAGDTGALLLGYVLATVSIMGMFKVYALISFAVPFIVLALPIFDTAFAFLRRILKGQNPMKPDRGHLHHRLIDMGLSQKQAVAILYCVSIVLGLAAVVLTTSGAVKAIIFVLAFVVAAVVGFFIMRSTIHARQQRLKGLEKKEPAPEPRSADNPLRVLSVFGTRPEAVKMAPLVLELARRPEVESLCCVTAQHRELLDSMLEVFGVTPDYDLDLMTKDQTLTDVTTRVLESMQGVLAEAKPDVVLVHGDTTTAFSASLAAFYAKIPVGHVEAGLRTWDRYSPYPEEMNRELIGRLASCHFAPTANNANNLRREGIVKNVFITGNTVIDAMKYTVGDGEFSDETLRSIDFEGRRVIAMTCHRHENYGEPMEAIFTAVRRIAEEFEDVVIVYPVHPAPTVRSTAELFLGGAERVKLIEPLDAREMHRLMNKSYFVLTDSGGLQEEAPALGKPVVVARRETERPEAVEAGTVELAGVTEQGVYTAMRSLLTDEKKYARMARAVNPYGDGKACERIADALLYVYGGSGKAPEAFGTQSK